MTARDDLEATLRRNLTDVNVPAQFHNAVVDAFLPAATAWAAGDSDTVQAARREVLHRERTDLAGDRRSADYRATRRTP